MSYSRKEVKRIRHWIECDGHDCRVYEKLTIDDYDNPMFTNDWRTIRFGPEQTELNFHSRDCADAYFAYRVARQYEPVG
jgi:hypothetical protein